MLKLSSILILLSSVLFIICLEQKCFEMNPNRSLFARPAVSLRDLTLVDCFNACLEMPRNACKSVTFSRKTKVCQLNTKSKTNVKIVKNPMADFYHRLCFTNPKPNIRRDTALAGEDCFATQPGKVLIGIVDQLVRDIATINSCQDHCANSKAKYGIVCKSAMFYEKEKECIIASQDKTDIPDLFIDDEKAVYIENLCDSKEGKATADIFKGSSKFDSSHDEEKHATTTLATILAKTHVEPARIEFSGYDGPSDHVSNLHVVDEITTTTSTTTTTTTTPAPTIAPKLVDSYNVVNEPKTGYGRRLRDTRNRQCFEEVRPKGKVEALRVIKAYSLDQCTDMCRLCKDCLIKKQKCRAVAFDMSRELCALASKEMIDGGSFQDNIIYHNRVDC